MGAPLPLAPPCILQRCRPRAAGDRHGFPLRVRAWHRRAWFMRDGPWCMGLSFSFDRCPTPLGDRPDNGLAALMDVDVLDNDLLLALAAMLVQREEQLAV